MVSLITIIVAVATLAAAYVALCRWWLGLTARLGLPPGPVDGSIPLLGNAGDMVSRYRYFVLSSVAAYGDTWTAFFFEPVVAVSTHAGVSRMICLEATGELVGGKWPNAWKRIFGRTQLFAVSGARHQRMRSALAPSLALGDGLDALVPVLSHRVRIGLDGWVRAGAAGSAGLDVVPRLRLLAVAVLTAVCFGRPHDDLACAALLKLLDAMGDGFLVVLPANVPGSTMRSATAATRAVWAVVGAEVDSFMVKLKNGTPVSPDAAAAAPDPAPAAASSGSSSARRQASQPSLTAEERVCVLARLLAVDLSDGGGRLTRQEVVENISMYLYHGAETLCTLLTTVTMYASQPAELSAAGIDRDTCLTADNLHALPFLAACVTEALRVCPPVLGTYRATGATTVALGGGVTCRGGATLALSIYGACMDAHAWADAHLFRPQRHLATAQEETGGGRAPPRAAPSLPSPPAVSSPAASPPLSPVSPSDDRSPGSFGSRLTDASDTGGSSNDLTPPAAAARRGGAGGSGGDTAPGNPWPPRRPFGGAAGRSSGGSSSSSSSRSSSSSSPPPEADTAAATAAASAVAGHPAYVFGTPARLCTGAALAPLVARVYLATLITAYVPRLTTPPVMVETLPHARPRFRLWLVPTAPRR